MPALPAANGNRTLGFGRWEGGRSEYPGSEKNKGPEDCKTTDRRITAQKALSALGFLKLKEVEPLLLPFIV
ncbi:uncharacterized protein G2W53_032425 [Senna tora]|uniref:Uncharacterized protein n=1 Tax=Senna tora TaxID=362788 RepID=A0A834SWQ4_9FABA|nr:uncharacterized protein G2W53_032425 [Senna tora]